MPVFVIGQNHAGKKGSKSGGQSNHVHKNGGGYYQQQGHGCKNFTESGSCNDPEHIPGQVATRDNDACEDDQDHEHLEPACDFHSANTAHLLTMQKCSRRMDGQQGKDRKDGNHSDVLQKQHRECCLSGCLFHQVFLCQGLENNRC